MDEFGSGPDIGFITVVTGYHRNPDDKRFFHRDCFNNIFKNKAIADTSVFTMFVVVQVLDVRDHQIGVRIDLFQKISAAVQRRLQAGVDFPIPALCLRSRG